MRALIAAPVSSREIRTFLLGIVLFPALGGCDADSYHDDSLPEDLEMEDDALVPDDDAAILTAPAQDTGTAVTGPTGFPFADPDTIAVAGKSNYATYGTEVRGRDKYGKPAWGAIYHVPVTLHGGGETLGLTNLPAQADAMPGGPGAWADSNQEVWAPSVSYFGNRYIMHYAATKLGTASAQYPLGHRCIGRAVSTSPTGPFTGQAEVACPPNGRWAIDPDTFVDAGKLYMVYRDDNVTPANQTGISVVQLASDGSALWSTRRTALLSSDVMNWDFISSTGKDIIENPTMMRVGNGQVHLFFSGYDWDGPGYAIGVANCGDSPLPATRCKLLGSSSRPYWGYTGPGGRNPLHALPHPGKGPGGMSLFRTHGGAARVVWHYWSAATYPQDRRRAVAEVLSYSNGVFSIP